MKNILKLSCVCLLLAAMFSSCGDDRSGEYYDLTKENQWIYSAMQEHYLWADRMPSLERSQFFATTSKFFSSLLYKDDKVSFFEEAVAVGDYGLTFALMRDPLSIRPGKVYALVLDVAKGSPAWECGLKRGVWISAVNGMALSTSSNNTLTTGQGMEVVTEYIDYSDEDTCYMWEMGDTISVLPATDYQEHSIPLDTIYNLRDRKVGYVVFNNMDGDIFAELAQRIMLDFANAQTSDIIFDLRYCKGGTLTNALSLASTIVPTSAYNTPFCKLIGAGEASDTVYNYSEQTTNLSDKNFYIILGKDTHGVAELLTSSVTTTLGTSKVITIGTATAGGGMMTKPVASPFGFTINPAVSVMQNAEGKELPSAGIVPACAVNELTNPLRIHELGSEQERILFNVFHLIVNGMLPE